MDDRMRFVVEMHEVAMARALERTLADLALNVIVFPSRPECCDRAYPKNDPRRFALGEL